MRNRIMSLLVSGCLALVSLFGTACAKPRITGSDSQSDDSDVSLSDSVSSPDDSSSQVGGEITVWTPENIRERPVTKDDLLIGSYISLSNSTLGQSSKEQIKRLADGGLNFMPLASCISSAGMIEQGERIRRDLSSLDWWKRIDEVMKENNMVYYYSTKAGLGNDYETTRGTEDPVSDAAVAAAGKIVPELDNCVGYMMKDEPSYAEFDTLATYAKKYATIKEDTYALVNHFPFPVGYSGDYYSYMKSWVTKAGAGNIKYLGHDYYPFGTGSTNYNILSAMEAMRKVSVETGVDLACFPQSCAWSGTRMPAYEEIKWELNAYLAHGFTMFMYFNYSMYPYENCSDAIFDLSGNMLHQELYDALAEYHCQIRAMAANTDFTDLVSQTVLYTSASAPTGTRKLGGGWYIDNANLKTNTDYLLAYLTNGDESESYLVIMNNSFEKAVSDQEFVLGSRADTVSGWELYDMQTGEFEALDVADGSFTLSFDRSEAKFIKLVK